jgi:hypothetical protein
MSNVKECAYCDEPMYCKPHWVKELKGWVCDECKAKLDSEKKPSTIY